MALMRSQGLKVRQQVETMLQSAPTSRLRMKPNLVYQTMQLRSITFNSRSFGTLVSPDIARTIGIDVKRLNLVYLEMFALTVALGLRYLGVLLMGSLIIIPAATAKRVSRNLTQMLVMASVLAILVTIVGTLAAAHFQRPTGPFIVTIAAAVFFLSALWGD